MILFLPLSWEESESFYKSDEYQCFQQTRLPFLLNKSQEIKNCYEIKGRKLT